MPASGNNDSTNVFNSSIQTMYTQYKTLTISHVKEEHLKNILITYQEQIYCILEYIYIPRNKK